MTPYRAVDVDELQRTLGDQCSPVGTRAGYVIGPDIIGRLCHVASCFSMEEARRMAERLNKKPEQKP
jgi:hypothetical protein